MTPPGLLYVEGYVVSSEQDRLLEAIDEQPWITELRRRVQHYGYRYDYKARAVDRGMYLGPLPHWAQPLIERLVGEGYMPERPDQLIVNEYLPGQGIAPHVDCIPCFGPVVASLSLGSPCVMVLSRGEQELPLVLEPCSLLVFAGEARTRWRHAIPARKSDMLAGVRQPRDRRVSLTFRTVRLSAD
jgi:alkylated DNA repair dioxygenase AlkB